MLESFLGNKVYASEVTILSDINNSMVLKDNIKGDDILLLMLIVL